MNFFLLGLHLFAQRFDRLPGYLVIRVVEFELLLVLVLALDKVCVALDKLVFFFKLFPAHIAVLSLELLLNGR